MYGGITGAICGIAVALFTVCARIIYSFVIGLYSDGGILTAVCLVVLVLLCCMLMAVIQTLCPAARGSGIPLAQGGARGILKIRWLRTLAALISGSLLGFLAGLPLGSEGPSVGIGGMIGEGVGKAAKKPSEFRRYLISGGASAGLAAAFNAPLTGICFALEETHQRIMPTILTSTVAAVITGVITSQSIFYGLGHVPYLGSLGVTLGTCVLPFLKPTTARGCDIFVLALIAAGTGIVCGTLGLAFNRAIAAISALFNKINHAVLRLLPAFVLTVVCGLCLHVSIGSGEHTFSSAYENAALWLVFTVLAVRFITTVIASGAGATGGLMLPMLALGGLTGTLIARLAVMCGLDAAYTPNVVLLGVCAFLAASVRAPVTAAVLSVEMTASFTNLLPCVIAVAVSSLITVLTKTEPLYEHALKSYRKL